MTNKYILKVPRRSKKNLITYKETIIMTANFLAGHNASKKKKKNTTYETTSINTEFYTE